MKVSFLRAMDDNTWSEELVDVPADAIPDKFSRGSVKWNKHATSFAEETLGGEGVVHLCVLDANPEEEV